MKSLYKKIWQLAKPYYQKGRPMDIKHVQWMMEQANYVCKKEKLDDSLLLPLVILHDVGYGVTKPVYYDQGQKKLHMIEGEKIAKDILKKVKYPKDKIEKISYWISIHDRWIWGKNDIYKNDKYLGTFNDLDFT